MIPQQPGQKQLSKICVYTVFSVLLCLPLFDIQTQKWVHWNSESCLHGFETWFLLRCQQGSNLYIFITVSPCNHPKSAAKKSSLPVALTTLSLFTSLLPLLHYLNCKDPAILFKTRPWSNLDAVVLFPLVQPGNWVATSSPWRATLLLSTAIIET